MDTINTRNQLVSHIRALQKNIVEFPDEWENKDLSSYLEALSAWLEDCDGYYENRGQEVPNQGNWSLIADMLSAAKVYE